MAKIRRIRSTASLPQKLHEKLNAYGFAATAAGVGLLTAAVPSEARIVYTPVNENIGNGYGIDLNHDGSVDFTLKILSGGNGSSADAALVAYSSIAQQNAVVSAGVNYAAALRAGVRVGSKKGFTGKTATLFDERIKIGYSNTRFTYWTGPWAKNGKGLKHHFLGLKFVLNGQPHYGWARISTAPPFSGDVITGFAYETKANKAIVAGDKRGATVAKPSTSATTTSPARQASLGVLARGAAGLFWRRNGSAGE